MSQPTYPSQGQPQVYTPAPGSSYVAAPPAEASAPQQPKKKGMFGNFMKEMDKVGKKVSQGIDSASKKIEETVDQKWSSYLLDMFKNGNTVQLVSRSSSRTVQIVMSSAGVLVLDAMGPLDPNASNSTWTVINEGNNQVRLHNYGNFMAVIKGQVVVVPVPLGTAPGPETKFQLSQTQNFVMLESLTERNNHVGFLNTGELKPAVSTFKEISSQYGVKLLSTAYPDLK